jgi:hypothetical protein
MMIKRIGTNATATAKRARPRHFPVLATETIRLAMVGVSLVLETARTGADSRSFA